jgi:hypothetical protein
LKLFISLLQLKIKSNKKYRAILLKENISLQSHQT